MNELEGKRLRKRNSSEGKSVNGCSGTAESEGERERTEGSEAHQMGGLYRRSAAQQRVSWDWNKLGTG